ARRLACRRADEQPAPALRRCRRLPSRTRARRIDAPGRGAAESLRGPPVPAGARGSGGDAAQRRADRCPRDAPCRALPLEPGEPALRPGGGGHARTAAAPRDHDAAGVAMSKQIETDTDGGRLRPPPAEGIETIKRALVGQPMPTHAMEDTLLRKRLALPIF